MPSEARRELGLPPAGKLVPVSGGGWELATSKGHRHGSRSTRCSRSLRSAVAMRELRRRLPTRYGTNQRVRLEGYTEQIGDWLAAADALVHSTGGLTILEAHIRGCPAISFGWGRGHIRMNNAAFRRYGLADVVTSKDELSTALRRALQQRKPQDLSLLGATSAASVVLVVRPPGRQRQARQPRGSLLPGQRLGEAAAPDRLQGCYPSARPRPAARARRAPQSGSRGRAAPDVGRRGKRCSAVISPKAPRFPRLPGAERPRGVASDRTLPAEARRRASRRECGLAIAPAPAASTRSEPGARRYPSEVSDATAGRSAKRSVRAEGGSQLEQPQRAPHFSAAPPRRFRTHQRRSRRRRQRRADGHALQGCGRQKRGAGRARTPALARSSRHRNPESAKSCHPQPPRREPDARSTGDWRNRSAIRCGMDGLAAAGTRLERAPALL